MKLRQAIPIVLGAIFGTSITGWVICLSGNDSASGWLALFSTSTLTCITALFGIYFRMFTKNRFQNHLGDIMLGFAILMFGMSAMSGAVAPLKDSEVFINVLTKFSNPILGILVGIAFTSILQSASTGILQALAMTGAVTFDMRFHLSWVLLLGLCSSSVICSRATTDGRCMAYLTNNFLVWFSATIFYGLNAF